MKHTLKSHDATGKLFMWSFRYSATLRLWLLTDHTGYERTLERAWTDSVPRIRSILANHGLEANVS
jgi:hypothetical protein